VMLGSRAVIRLHAELNRLHPPPETISIGEPGRRTQIVASPTIFHTPECRAASGKVEKAFAVPENKVVVFSKSYCPHCKRVKSLFAELHVPIFVFELDKIDDGARIQTYLSAHTNQNTVPNVFIHAPAESDAEAQTIVIGRQILHGKVHIGGRTDTEALHSAGKLVPLLEAAGVKLSV